MKVRLLAAVSAVIALAGAASAHAGVTVAIPPEVNNLYGPLSLGQTMLQDFDNPANPNVQFNGLVRPSPGYPFENPISTSAPPPYTGPGAANTMDGGTPITVDPGKYASVQAGQTSSFETLNGYYLTSFSFYMGSPDTYNHIEFYDIHGDLVGALSGTAIWDSNSFDQLPPYMGDRSWGYRVYYDFGDARVTTIKFTTENTNAFEFDSLAGTLAVPEPSTWALMIAGFGAMGGVLRRQRRLAA